MVMNIKKSIKILGLAILVEAFTQIYAGAQGTSPSPFSFNSDVYLDYVSVLKGISRTSGVMGNIDAQVSFDTEKAKWWKGGTFFVYGIHDFGFKPSLSNVGSYQPLDNIETFDKDQLFEFWYKQQFKNLYVIVGQSNVNYNFFHLDAGNNFINSNFNTEPDVAGNIPISTFSKNTLGIKCSWKITPELTYKGCVYNGYTGTSSDNPYDLQYRFGAKEGIFTTHQLGYKWRRDSVVTNTLRLGFWVHTGTFVNSIDSTEYKGKIGFYALGDKMIVPFAGDYSRGVSAFFITGYVPDKYSLVKFYYSYGVNIAGIFSKHKADLLGFGLSNTVVNRDIADVSVPSSRSQENIFELYYLLNLNNNIVFTPDFQYIKSPGGSPVSNNAIVGILRMMIKFN
jgi:porin